VNACSDRAVAKSQKRLSRNLESEFLPQDAEAAEAGKYSWFWTFSIQGWFFSAPVSALKKRLAQFFSVVPRRGQISRVKARHRRGTFT
jgi:hypothetical protein